jgi:hypothetical protein
MTDIDSLEMVTSSKTIRWHNPNPHIHVSLNFNLSIQYKMDKQTVVNTFPIQSSLKAGDISWPWFLNFILEKAIRKRQINQKEPQMNWERQILIYADNITL